jgi:hypothetical protein
MEWSEIMLLVRLSVLTSVPCRTASICSVSVRCTLCWRTKLHRAAVCRGSSMAYVSMVTNRLGKCVRAVDEQDQMLCERVLSISLGCSGTLLVPLGAWLTSSWKRFFGSLQTAFTPQCLMKTLKRICKC